MTTFVAWVTGLIQRLRETSSGARAEAELDEEMQHHLALEADRLMRTGLDPEQARRRALQAFGSSLHVKEQARNERGFLSVEMVLRDLRYAWRGLRKSPGFATAAILTLALGIGATTAVFTVVDTVLLRPLPYPESEQLVRIMQQNSPTNRWGLSVADVLGIDELQTTFESVATLQRGSVAFTGAGQPQQLVSGRVTAEWFTTLGVRFDEGRGFLPEEGDQGGADVVVLAPSFRDRSFGPGVTAVGQSIVLDGVPHTIVGVLDEAVTSLAGLEADVWPILRLETPNRRGPFGLRTIGRLRAEATIADARLDLDHISVTLFPRWADGFSDETARLTPFSLQEVIVGGIGSQLWFVLGAVAGVLLIAVANVANLLLVRSTARRPELALRASLGASRFQIARQLLTESLLLAFFGGVAALVVAWGGLELLQALGPTIPRIDEVVLDARIMGIASALTLGAAVLFGMAPLAQVTKKGGLDVGGIRGATGGSPASGLFRSALVAGEFAIAFPLLTGALLLIGSLNELQRVDPGYNPDNVVTASVSLPAEGYPDYEAIQEFWTETLARLNARPTIQAAGIGTMLPPTGSGDSNNFDLVHRPVDPGTAEPVSTWNTVSPEFLSALDIPLLAGRLFSPFDNGEDGEIAIVSESWARRFASDRDPLGLQFYSGGDRSQATTVIGVVGDIKLSGLDSTDDAAVYQPFAASQYRRVNLLIRSSAASSDALTEARTVLATMDPTLPLANVQTMDERMSRAVAQPRLWSVLLGLFSALGLVLAAIGAYGVLSYYVGRQSRELGIRIALGAEPSSVRNLVLRRGLTLALVGISVGAVISVASARWISSLTFGVSPTDPRILFFVAASLLGISILSCLYPAVRATRIDPMRALRSE